jgi:hypothetical protein
MHHLSNQIRGGENPDYKYPIQRKAQPEEVAQLIAWLLCDGSTFISAWSIFADEVGLQVIDGGMTC